MTFPPSFRPAVVIVLIVTSAAVLGCDTNEAEPESDEAVELNLETLEAETEHGTLEAERVDASYVTAMGEGQAIGIAWLGEEGGDPEQETEREVVVFLYEGGDLAVLIDPVNSEGEAGLESADRSDFDATVELSVEDEAVTGTATFRGEETAFTAEAASGVAGVYWADGTGEDPDASGSWVVLPDERQWGCACVIPYTGPCCTCCLSF